MRNCLKNKRFLSIFLLISLVGFSVLPKFCLADDFENINPEELSKYLELPEKDANKLMDTLRQVFTTEGILAWSSGDTTEEEISVAVTLLKVVTMQALSHLLVDAPLEITQKIIKAATDIVQIYINPAVFWEKFEKLTVEKAIEEGKKQLFQNEVRVTPGAIKFKYDSYKGVEKEIILQYVMIYKPERNEKRAEVVIRFYMPNSIEAPAPEKYKGMTSLYVPDLKKDFSPFIVEINGIVEKDEFGNYRWINEGGEISHPSVNITFSDNVPDLGIKPLSTWEKYVLKPIETQIKDIEIIITKVTGKSLNLAGIWDKIKSFFSKINPPAPAALIETPLPEEEEPSVEVGQEIGQEIFPSVEVKPQQLQQLEPKELTLEEIQEMLDDIAERIDMMSVEVAKLTGKEIVSGEEEALAKEKIEEPEKEETKESEEEVGQEVVAKLCQRIPGSYPARNRVILNEIAWMGTSNSADDEWIELKNISGTEINLAGWQLLDKDNQIKISFNNQPRVLINGFFLLERTNDETVPQISADLIYTGNLSNTNEALYLFDENCQLQDMVEANLDWPAGNNTSKRTMERKSDLTWQTSLNPGGTPKRENSSGYTEMPTYTGGTSASEPKLTLSYLPSIRADEMIEVTLSGSNLDNATYDVKISIQSDTTTISEIYNEKLEDWQSSQNYVTSTVSGTSFSKNFKLKIKDKYKNFEGEADIFAKIRKTGKTTSYLGFDGKINITAPPPILEVSTTNLSFEAIKDVKAPEDQFLIIQNSGGSNLNWQISSSVNWLNFNPSEGSISSHSSSIIEVSVVDINELATGTYSTTFNIEATGAQPSQETISVSLTIYEKKFAQNVVISEVQIASTSSTDDEFIELYNPKETPVDLSQWSIQKSYSTGTTVYKKNFEEGNKISAKGYFLIVNANAADQNLLASAGMIYGGFSLSKNNTIYLVKNREEIENSSDTDIADLVGFGENVFAEGNPAPNPPAGKSLGRKIAIDDEGNPNYLDLNNNRLDFGIQEPTPGKQNENLHPIAKFDFSPKNPYVGDNILFDASGSRDIDGNIVSYIWDFGDGSSTSATTSQITKFFSISSTFTVSLSVVDDSGATSTATSTQIFVKSREPLSIVINEISWAGTRTSSSDEWIEFYNNTTSTIDIINWSIAGAKTGECLNFSEADGITTTTISAGGYLIYAERQEAVKNGTQSIVDIWDKEIEMDDIFPSQLNLYDVPGCHGGDLIDTIGEESEGWFAGNATDSISMERISATTTGATSTNWANNNLITRNGKDAGNNNINGTPKAKNSVSISPTTISSLPFDEFSEITLTYFGSPYIIQNNLTIPATSTLKIEPGVTLKFSNSAGMEIKGKLEAIGFEDRKIIFTSIKEEGLAAPGDWDWLYFEGSFGSKLKNVILRYGGALYGGWPVSGPFTRGMVQVENGEITIEDSTIEKSKTVGLWLKNSSSTIEKVSFLEMKEELSPYIDIVDAETHNKPISLIIEGGTSIIKNCTFSDNYYGIYIRNNAKPRIEENNLFENNIRPIYLNGSSIFFRNNLVRNNDLNGISVSGGCGPSDIWESDLPFVVGGMSISSEGNLTIRPGSVIKMKEGATINVQGKIIAQGTSTEKIIFTSLKDDIGGDTNNDGNLTQATSSDWGYLRFSNTNSTSTLDNVIIRYGGKKGMPWYNNFGVITLENKDVKITIKDSIIENNVFGFSVWENTNCEIINQIINEFKSENTIFRENESDTYSS
jgi:parallel beta-helix repeat protein